MLEPSSGRRLLAVTWIAKPGLEDRVKGVLKRLAVETIREPGCIKYIVYQATDDPAHFLLSEEYRDAVALIEHSESDHFKRYVLGEAASLLELRQRIELTEITDRAADVT